MLTDFLIKALKVIHGHGIKIFVVPDFLVFYFCFFTLILGIFIGILLIMARSKENKNLFQEDFEKWLYIKIFQIITIIFLYFWVLIILILNDI